MFALPLPIAYTLGPTSWTVESVWHTKISTEESREQRDQAMLDNWLLEAAAYRAGTYLPLLLGGQESPLPPTIRAARRLVDQEAKLDDADLLLAIIQEQESRGSWSATGAAPSPPLATGAALSGGGE